MTAEEAVVITIASIVARESRTKLHVRVWKAAPIPIAGWSAQASDSKLDVRFMAELELVDQYHLLMKPLNKGLAAAPQSTG